MNGMKKPQEQPEAPNTGVEQLSSTPDTPPGFKEGQEIRKQLAVSRLIGNYLQEFELDSTKKDEIKGKVDQEASRLPLGLVFIAGSRINMPMRPIFKVADDKYESEKEDGTKVSVATLSAALTALGFFEQNAGRQEASKANSEKSKPYEELFSELDELGGTVFGILSQDSANNDALFKAHGKFAELRDVCRTLVNGKPGENFATNVQTAMENLLSVLPPDLSEGLKKNLEIRKGKFLEKVGGAIETARTTAPQDQAASPESPAKPSGTPAAAEADEDATDPKEEDEGLGLQGTFANIMKKLGDLLKNLAQSFSLLGKGNSADKIIAKLLDPENKKYNGKTASYIASMLGVSGVDGPEELFVGLNRHGRYQTTLGKGELPVGTVLFFGEEKDGNPDTKKGITHSAVVVEAGSLNKAKIKYVDENGNLMRATVDNHSLFDSNNLICALTEIKEEEEKKDEKKEDESSKPSETSAKA